MLTIAKKYVDEFDSNDWMFIGGSVGSGKTHICTATLQEIMKKGNQGIYKRWHEIVSELKEDMNNNKSNQYIYELTTCNLLYIDDFLKNYTKSDLGIAFRIIQGRHDRNLPTIISSEFYLSEIDEMDSAIGSRIKEKSNKFTINILREEKKNFRLEGM
jgi:DNA replication protein DnaC